MSPQCPPRETPGGQANTALPVWWTYSLSASAASGGLELDELAGCFMNAMKNRPPSSVPVCGSIPSVKE